MNKVYLTNWDIQKSAMSVANTIGNLSDLKISLFGIPRGGIPAAYAVQASLRALGYDCSVVDMPDDCDAIIDDIIDTGRTKAAYEKYGKPIFALYERHINLTSGEWLVFPWEGLSEEGDTSASDIPIRLLQYIGEDPFRGGLLETPGRFIKAWDQYTSGYGQNPRDILKVFKDGAEAYDEMVLVKGIPVYSHCEHHLAPFFGVAHIAYIPDGRIVGLSKLSRLVDCYARRLQVQERMTNQIADAIEDHLQPQGVAVVIECRHLCMESRGIQRQGTCTITSAMRGAFREKPEARSEFLGLIK